MVSSFLLAFLLPAFIVGRDGRVFKQSADAADQRPAHGVRLVRRDRAEVYGGGSRCSCLDYFHGPAPPFVFSLCIPGRGSRSMGSRPACLHSIPARTPGMSHTVRRSCAGHKHRHEYGLAIVSGRRLCCRVRCVLSHFLLHAILAVTPFPGVKMCAAFLAYSVRFAHVITSVGLFFARAM